MNNILVIGATGAQGSATIKYLSSTQRYNIFAFTRSAASPQATALASLPNVKLIVSDSHTGYDANVFLSAAANADYVLVNTDGFALGEQAETYWGIRLFELSARAGVKHFVYSGLDSLGPKTNYDPELYCGHYQGKAKVQDWMHAQKDLSMKWTIIRSGPYMEMLSALMCPAEQADGSLHFQLPMDDGAIPFIYLGDFGRYIDWVFSNRDVSAGLDLGIATTHATGTQVAEACEKATGKPSKYTPIPIEVWNSVAWKALPNGPDTKIGFQTVKDHDSLLMTFGENFAHWWKLYQASADNTGLIQRDYAFLDKILPDRVKSVDDWMSKVNYTGAKENLLNLQVDTE